ncbi:MAG: CoB--CoM heterodisulfide reductase iron-sulfur subunit B family protein [Planctomycetota bacterium]|jgi:heterodisulfide reductase subunit B
MKVSYYPGCTLKTKSKNLEIPGIAAMAALGVELVELERWNCCGVTFSLADDDLIHVVAPVRDLIRVKEEGFDKVVTLCSMCYNTLAQANHLMRNDEEKRKTLNTFMEEEPDYSGEVEVLHLFNFLRDEIGWDKVKEAVKVPLKDLKVAPNYGCTLVRPKEVAIDSPEHPRFMTDFLNALSAEPVEYPAATECCGAYQMVAHPEASMRAVANILNSASGRGAEAMASSCPLCEYNIGRQQPEVIESHQDVKPIPTFFFTQLLALALGLDEKTCCLEQNGTAARALLESKGILASV